MSRSIAAILGLAVALVCACGDERGVRSLDQVYGSLGQSGAPGDGRPLGTTDDADYETGGSDCVVTSASVQVVDATGNTRSIEYTGCRVRWTASSRVLTWQLTTSLSSGSLLSPGDDWINVSVHGDSAENITFPIVSASELHPASISEEEAVLAITLDGRRVRGAGTLRVGTNKVNTKTRGGALDATFDSVTFVGTSSATRLYGSVSLRASSGGDSTGSCPPCDGNITCEIAIEGGSTSRSTFQVTTRNGVCATVTGNGNGNGSDIVFACGGRVTRAGSSFGTWKNCMKTSGGSGGVP